MGNIFESLEEKPSVFRDREKLSPHYVPDHLPFREEQIKELASTLFPVIKGRKPENVFIYGSVGTGKTAVAKYVIRELEEFAKKRGVDVLGVYVNNKVYNTSYKIFTKIMERIDPEKNLVGFSVSLIYDMILSHLNRTGARLVVILDEVDSVRNVSDVIYMLNRANDMVESGSLSLVGISNNPAFKDSLSAPVRSTLCQKELVFPPYTAKELEVILRERAEEAFREGVVEDSAVKMAAAYAAKQSGDARYALQLLLRAGDIADERGDEKVTDEHVRLARKRVEEDMTLELISTLQEHKKILIYTLALLSLERKGMRKLVSSEPSINSGFLYNEYRKMAESLGLEPVSDRWFRDYLNELSTYGIISLTQATGVRGNTRFISLNLNPNIVKELLERELGLK